MTREMLIKRIEAEPEYEGYESDGLIIDLINYVADELEKNISLEKLSESMPLLAKEVVGKIGELLSDKK